MQIPYFKYHPDPIVTGHVITSETQCVCCGKSRGYIYSGPVYSIDEYTDCICPWCISDGSAHNKLDAFFTDEVGIGAGGEWDDVSNEIIEEVACRTPGFSGWQPENWWTHCNDAAQFLGRAGKIELDNYGSQAIAAIRNSTGIQSDEKWINFYKALDKNGSPTAYVFRCSHCGLYGGYQDCD